MHQENRPFLLGHAYVTEPKLGSVGRQRGPGKLTLMSLCRITPKMASNMLYFGSQICYLGQGSLKDVTFTDSLSDKHGLVFVEGFKGFL